MHVAETSEKICNIEHLCAVDCNIKREQLDMQLSVSFGKIMIFTICST